MIANPAITLVRNCLDTGSMRSKHIPLSKMPKSTTVCRTEQSGGGFLRNLVRMKIAKMTKKQLASVRCPTCGVPAGNRCLLLAGVLRFEPHMSQKIAVAAIERERIPRAKGR